MIDPTTFNYEDSVWKDIFLHLVNSGFDVYSPSTKTGECTKKYIVVTVGASTKHTIYRTNNDIYTVICYVPKDNYSELEPFVNSVLKVMKELEPYVRPNGSRTPSYYDDTIKAHNISIDYVNSKLIS